METIKQMMGDNGDPERLTILNRSVSAQDSDRRAFCSRDLVSSHGFIPPLLLLILLLLLLLFLLLFGVFLVVDAEQVVVIRLGAVRCPWRVHRDEASYRCFPKR